MSNTTYLDFLMMNHPLETDTIPSISEDDFEYNKQVGGTDKDKPTGGFPLLFKCSDKDIKKREFTKPAKSVSMADIISQKKITPFIQI